MSKSSIGQTDLMVAVQQVVDGQATVEDVQKILTDRPSVVNIQDPKGRTAFHIACSPVSRKYTSRDKLIPLLLQFGANPFLVDANGLTAPEVAPEPRDRESIIATILRHRIEVEGTIDSVAPLNASRLMKRSQHDRGFGIFSNVGPNCLYYLYKGAIYLWDTVADVEHVVYQPRATNPEIQAIESRLDSHHRKKSVFAKTGTVTDNSFDINDDELLANQLKRLESDVVIVSHFTIVSGLDAQQTNIPASGCTEWVVTDIGVVISVQMNSRGVVIGKVEGSFSMPSRRKSHVCGAAATYEAGFGPRIRVYPKSVLHFHTQPEDRPAFDVCCALDGIRGTLAYVLTKPRVKAAAAAPPAQGRALQVGLPPIFSSGAHGATVESASKRNSYEGLISFDRASSRASESPATGLDSSSGMQQHSQQGASGGLTVGPGGTPTSGFLAVQAFHSAATSPLGMSHGSTISFKLDQTANGSVTSAGGLDDTFASEGAAANAFNKEAESTGVTYQQLDIGGQFAQSLDVSVSAALGDSTGSTGKGPATFLPPYEKRTVFRVVVPHTMTPKDGLNDLMRNYCAKWDPWNGTAVYDFALPLFPSAEALASGEVDEQLDRAEPISVHVLGRTKFILFTNKGPIVAETADKEPVRFALLKTNPVGLIHSGCARPAPFTPRLRTVLKRNFFVQVSQVVEISEVTDDLKAIPLIRTLGDRNTPHRFLPLFHPTEDAAVLLYQSGKRQEMCRYDFGTSKMTSVCRLPKPSSLRFYPSSDKDKETVTLSELWFAFNKSGEQLLRYNVSMHVMSIYDWSEMMDQGRKHNCAFSMVRSPVSVESPSVAKALREAQQAQASAAALPVGEPCVWLTIVSKSLNSILAKVKPTGTAASSPLTPLAVLVGDTTAAPTDTSNQQTSPTDALVVRQEKSGCDANSLREEIHQTLRKTFQRFARAAGAQKFQEGTYNGDLYFSASFALPLEAVRAGIRLLRETLDAEWSSEVLSVPAFAPELLPYRPKSVMERQHPDPNITEDAKTKFLRRGPMVRLYLTSGHTLDTVTENRLMRSLENVLTPAIDGVLAIDGPIMKIVSPLLPTLASGAPPAQSQVGRLGILVPYELDSRLVGQKATS